MYKPMRVVMGCMDKDDIQKPMILCKECTDTDCARSKFRRQTEDLLDLKKEYESKI
jgi:hypothetical protein